MSSDATVDERTKLLSIPRIEELSGRRRSSAAHVRPSSRDGLPSDIISSHISKEEHALGGTAVGERLPYNDYTTIDWLHEGVSTYGSSSTDRLN